MCSHHPISTGGEKTYRRRVPVLRVCHKGGLVCLFSRSVNYIVLEERRIYNYHIAYAGGEQTYRRKLRAGHKAKLACLFSPSAT